MVVLCIFKIKVESKNSEKGTIKDHDYLQINIKMPNSNWEPPGSSEAPNQDLMDVDIRGFVVWVWVCLKLWLV